jgi:hypothetical protein
MDSDEQPVRAPAPVMVAAYLSAPLPFAGIIAVLYGLNEQRPAVAVVAAVLAVASGYALLALPRLWVAGRESAIAVGVLSELLALMGWPLWLCMLPVGVAVVVLVIGPASSRAWFNLRR